MTQEDTMESTAGTTIERPPAEAESIWLDLVGLPLRQHTVDAGGHETRYLEVGSGPPLILLHGASGHLEAYVRTLRELSQHFRVIAYDMLGHGYSAKPDLPYTIGALSDHLLGLMDALDVQAAHLSGQSLGAWVGAWTAAHTPDRVLKLVLNTPGNVADDPVKLERTRDATLRAVREASLETVRDRMRLLFREGTEVPEEMVRIRYAIYTQPEILRAMENLTVMYDPEVRAQYSWSGAWLGDIRAETLLLWSASDTGSDLDVAESLRSRIPGCRLELIHDAGHWPQWDAPREFERVHVEFLGTDGS
jgi:2-hydroxy-6-oxonona-2,4-dienedioate hydrolase